MHNGTWSEYRQTDQGGITALCTLALLNAGESPKEEHVAKALDYLRKLRPKTTYVVSLQTMVLCRATPVADDQDIIARNVQWLEDNPDQERPGRPQRRLVLPRCPGEPSVAGDGSNSQFALLALYEAGRAAETGQIHVTIHRETWERVRTYWINNQSTRRTAPGATTSPAPAPAA